MKKDDTKDTIIIFQKPELYFFPYYKSIIFSPFGIPEKSLRYLIYKVLYILRLPCCCIFWGEWKKYVRTARHIIIFDYGYQAGMETYIKKRNPDCKVSLFYWNIITKKRINYKLFSDKKAIFSTDKKDCAVYQFKYNHMFYPYEFQKPYDPRYQDRLFFLGADKGRAKEIAALCEVLQRCGIFCKIHLVRDRHSRVDTATFQLFTAQRLSYKEYLKEVDKAGILLDINQKGQDALTMRVVESIYLSKKLITNNKDISSYEFYNENNILILPEKIDDDFPKKVREFMDKPFLPYGQDVLRHFSFEHWKEGFE